ncbi:MAG: hypothetical protein ACJ0RL_04420 [Porticoccaceae bacterium]|nr:MAG: hypothetical protein CND57_03205 [SAR92 bacterium MED-G29]
MDIVIWIIALSLYALFWLWYCGVKGRLSKHEVEIFISSFEAKGLSESALLNIREFLEQDDGREFFMVNLLEIKSPKRESQKLLMGYFKKFMSGMIPRGGHPLFLAKAAAKNIENLNCEHADDWSSVGIIRYRSRRDFAQIVLKTFGSEHHSDKLLSLKKTLAFPSTTTLFFGSPKIIIALVLGLAAAVTQVWLLL